MRVLSAESMQAVDRQAIDELGIPGIVLMENAAIGVVDGICEWFPAARSAAVLCGPGNNGGDGLAIARQLDARGYAVEIVLVGAGRPPAGDAGVQLGICERIGLPIHRLEGDSGLSEALAAAAASDLLVDALFGTGLGRPLEGLFARVAEWLNDSERPVVAVDLPSGLSGSRAQPLGPHVVADLTVTFGVPKIAHIFPPAADAVGELLVADLGIPQRLFERAAGDLRLLVEEEMRLLIQPRAPEGHKGAYGHTLVVGGSEGKSGAALLATRAAIRSGAGLVTIAVPDALTPVLEASSLESMTLGLPVAADGGLAPEALERILEAAATRQSLALGPGLGTAPSTVDVVRRLVAETTLPLVLDADGLNAFAGRIDELGARRGPLVLTPHPAELARLMGRDKAAILADRPAAVREAAARSAAVVVLKGHLSLIADAEGIAINPTGNPGMATGGTGDVLTGLIAGLIGQGRSATEAAELGVYVHGLAGDLAAADRGELSLAAGDLLERLPDAFEELRGS